MPNLLRSYAGLAVASALLASVWGAFNMPAHSPSSFPVYFYQQVIGHLDGKSCPSYPVCSAYAREALNAHGLLVGGWLTLDRLIHEAGDMNQGLWFVIGGEKRLYDPLHRNDFWLQNGADQ